MANICLISKRVTQLITIFQVTEDNSCFVMPFWIFFLQIISRNTLRERGEMISRFLFDILFSLFLRRMLEAVDSVHVALAEVEGAEK